MLRMLAVVVMVAVGSEAKDSVWTEPAQPTTRDSVTFHLFLENNCCCTQYHGETVVVEDTVIYLSYEFDTRNCAACMCFAQGSWATFESDRLSAATYGVYNAGQVYCPPGEICPLGMLVPVRVGELTVSEPSSARPVRSARATPEAQATGRLFALDGRPMGTRTPRGAVIDSRGRLQLSGIR
jgi:hypothetical protein